MNSFLAETPVASIIFLLTIATSIYAFNNHNIYQKFMLNPYQVSKGKNLYQLITSGFIHKDFPHLIFNMLSFYFFAFNLERTIGHWQFGVLYLVSLILSDLPTVEKYKNQFWYNSLGASGAVCAVVFSYILFYPFSKMIIFPLPIPIPALLYGFIFLAYTTYAGKKSNDGINHQAHFYGAIAGIVLTIILFPQIISYFIAEVQNLF